MRLNVKLVRGGLAAVALTVMMAGQAQAAPLNLTPGSPDIAASSLAVVYDATTDALSVTSTAPLQYNPGPVFYSGGVYSLTATIDNTGNLVGTAALTISAVTPAASALSASLTQFGYNPSTGLLEFLGTVSGSNFPGLSAGMPFGVILATGITNLSFQGDFRNTGTGTSDNYGVPEPASIGLLALGALGLLARRRHE